MESERETPIAKAIRIAKAYWVANENEMESTVSVILNQVQPQNYTQRNILKCVLFAYFQQRKS